MSESQEVAALERRIEELKRELLAARRARGPEPVGDYEFTTTGGPATLASLFGDGCDLLVIHNMGESCPYCSLWADGINGQLGQVETRTKLVLCSPDPPETQVALAHARGWRFRMVCDATREFTRAMGYWTEEDGYWPGVSAFHRGASGQIVRVAHAPFGPGDDFCPAWPMLDLLLDGPQGWEPR